MIFNSFKYYGISCSLDGNEFYKFRGFEYLEKVFTIFEIENEELDQDDEYITSSESE